MLVFVEDDAGAETAVVDAEVDAVKAVGDSESPAVEDDTEPPTKISFGSFPLDRLFLGPLLLLVSDSLILIIISTNL